MGLDNLTDEKWNILYTYVDIVNPRKQEGILDPISLSLTGCCLTHWNFSYINEKRLKKSFLHSVNRQDYVKNSSAAFSNNETRVKRLCNLEVQIFMFILSPNQHSNDFVNLLEIWTLEHGWLLIWGTWVIPLFIGHQKRKKCFV